MEQGHSMKDIARQFLQLAAAGEAEEAYRLYVADDFKHHNQYFAGDRESLKQAMQDSFKQHPQRTFTIKMMMQEADKVITYSDIVIGQGELRIAVFHMLRFRENKIVELWDVGQPIAADSPNLNGMF